MTLRHPNSSGASSSRRTPNEHESEEDVFVFPATLTQRRFWLLHQLILGGNADLNMTLPFRLRGSLDRSALQRALNVIIARHETLRTTFAAERGELRQIIAPGLEVELQVSEAPELAGQDDDGFFKYAFEEAQYPFNLTNEPFVRGRLLKLSEHEHLLLLTVHRLVSDEWSNRVITRELTSSYAAFAQDGKPSLPDLSLQFADYADWQHERLAANDFAEQREYWRRNLQDAPPALALPIGQPHLTSESSSEVYTKVLPLELNEATQELATSEKTTPFAIFLAIFQLLLYRRTARHIFFTATPGSNRARADFESVVGPFVRPLLLRADLRDDPNLLQLTERAQETWEDALANQDIPFDLLLDDFPGADLPIEFCYRSNLARPTTLPGELTIEPLRRVSGGVLQALSFAVVEDENRLSLEIEYDSACFDRETIGQIIVDYEEIAREAIANPTRPISELSSLVRQQTLSTVPDSVGTRSIPSPESVRPYLGLQLQLIAIWEAVLGVRGIGIRDSFFDLGGNSLLLLRMLHRAEIACGKPILPGTFFYEPTVEKLAAEIARDTIDESPAILTVNDSGARTPFFYLHGDLSGGGFYSLRLSRALGLEQPFYVMPPQDVRTLPVAPSIEEMAAAHLQALRAIRPRGPYIIGGFCLGGLVAYELAQQILASGDSVEMLLLIDAAPEDKTLRSLRRLCVGLSRFFHWDDRSQLDRFGRWALRRAQFAMWYEMKAPEQLRLVLRQIRHRLTSIRGAWQQRPPPSYASHLDAEINLERDVPSAFLWASAGYRPKPYRAPMAVLLSEDLLQRGDHLAHAWQRLAPKVSVHPLIGSHLECITAHVDSLAGTIDRCLRDLLSGAHSLGKIAAVSDAADRSLPA